MPLFFWNEIPVKMLTEYSAGSSVASAQLTGPQNYQGDRLWDQAWMIFPLINCTNRCVLLSTDSADCGSFWSPSENSQKWGDWRRPEVNSEHGTYFLHWLTGSCSLGYPGSVKIECQFRSQFSSCPQVGAPTPSMPEKAWRLYGATSATNKVVLWVLVLLRRPVERGSYDKNILKNSTAIFLTDLIPKCVKIY